MLYQSERTNVTLQNSILTKKRRANFNYIMELDDDNLLYNFRQEAGLEGKQELPEIFHRGWELPTSQLRGHFAGHWLSAAAQMYKLTGDTRISGRLDYLLGEIKKCQNENGGQWCFTIPEKYLWWIRDGKGVWAPHYTIHKILMGLCDTYEYAGIDIALDILNNAAEWFITYTDGITREAMDDLMDRTETGGIMEAWADLYRHTKNPRHLELMHRYERPRYYTALLRGEDVLTNRHANTTVPEILGVCKAYEITREQRYLDIARAYWKLAVDERGYFATGGQTSGEVWTPMRKQAERLSNKNQEHCTVYNMMRLADFLYRNDDDVKYADYWERNLYNGILAQGYYEPYVQYAQSAEDERITEILSYFLPLEAGAKKRWGSKRDHFWCCHGSLVQANAYLLQDGMYYTAERQITVCQYFPSQVIIGTDTLRTEKSVYIAQKYDNSGQTRPKAINVIVDVDGDGQAFELRFRIPWWIDGALSIRDANGEAVKYTVIHGYACISRKWEKETIHLSLPKRITASPLDDRSDCVAFMDGPVVLAGLIDKEITLYGDLGNPAAMFIADDERQWGIWNLNWKTIHQPENIRFTPLYNICHQTYTTYFPVRKQPF